MKKFVEARPGRGMVMIEVLPEDTMDYGIEVAYGKRVSPNGVVIKVGEADMMGTPDVTEGDEVYVASSGVQQIEEDDKVYAVVHHGQIRLIWEKG